MQRETKTTFRLNETEIREAAIAWLRARGETVEDDAYISVDGDMPSEIVLVSVVTVKGVQL